MGGRLTADVPNVDPNKKIIYTRHARERMQQRGITDTMVRQTICGRDGEGPGNIPGSVKAWKGFGSMEVHVVYVEYPDRVVICTTWASQ